MSTAPGERKSIDELLYQWERFAISLIGEYPFGLDSYLDDLDLRALLERRGDELGESQQRELARLDDGVRQRTEEVSECVWGEPNAAKHGWTSEREWWYFRLPKRQGLELQDDLKYL